MEEHIGSLKNLACDPEDCEEITLEDAEDVFSDCIESIKNDNASEAYETLKTLYNKLPESDECRSFIYQKQSELSPIIDKMSVESITQTGVCEICDEPDLPLTRHGVCKYCFGKHYKLCSFCEDYYHSDIMEDMGGRLICETCHESINVCNNCGRRYDTNSDRWEDELEMCYQCAREIYINPYNYTRSLSPSSFKSINGGDLFLGVEAEVDGGRDFGYAVSKLEDIREHHDIFNMVHDGSLRMGKGFEIVSVPATFDYHIEEYPWENIFEICIDAGYRADDTDTCGLHLHIGRNSIDHRTASKINMFIAANSKFIERVARRPENYDYAKFKSVSEVEAIGNDSESRYEAMNFRTGNKGTIEFRMFKGTLDTSILYASMEFILSLIDFTKDRDIVEMKDSSAVKDYINYINSNDYNYVQEITQ